MLYAYIDAYQIKKQEEIENWRFQINTGAWLNGLYIQQAIASVLSESCNYFSKPINIFASNKEENNVLQELTEQEKIIENENAIKERMTQIDAMLNKKKKL